MTRFLVSLAALWLTTSCLTSSASGQGISTLVFPSEDEIRQALERGEIGINEYHRLLELSRTGVDTSALYLYDEIPNLSDFLSDYASLWTELESEQAGAFVDTASHVSRGYVRYRSGRELVDGGRSRFRSAIRFEPNEHWRIDGRMDREYTGAERIVSRSVEYRSATAALRRVRLGSFTERYGLGTVLGYAGRRLSLEDKLSGESLLYPDYGGFNGGSVSLAFGEWTAGGLVSTVRDQSHRIETVGGTIVRSVGNVDLSVTSAATRLTNRVTESRVSDTKSALTVAYRYKKGTVSAELARQWSEQGALAAIGEWRHRLEGGRIGLAAWHYDDRFVGLLSGSKSGSLSRRQTLNEVDYDFSDRRSGQSGFYARTVGQLGRRTDLIITAKGSAIDRDSSEVELLCGLIRGFGRGWELRVDYSLDNTRRLPTTESTEQRIRFEPSFTDGSVRIRTYIAYTYDHDRTDDTEEKYWSWFVRATFNLEEGGRVDLWSNASRITNGSLAYWYGYVQHEQPLFEAVSVIVKLSHRYSRHSTPSGYTQFSLQVTAGL